MSSTRTQLICNNFGGIRTKNEAFNNELITASDTQNVELYYTGTGVGIRTMDGNISINEDLKDDYSIIGVFESTQNETTIGIVYAENDTQGKLYRFSTVGGTLTLIKDGITVTGKCNGFDVQQGYSDLFFFTNGEYMLTYEYETNTTTLMNNLLDRDGNSVKGLIATIFDNRLFIMKNNKIWYSVTSNIYDFSTNDTEWKTSAGYIETLKNITATHEYLGSLAVFFNDSSVLIQVSDGDFSMTDSSPGGCAGVNSLVFHDTDLYFYDNTKKAVFSFKQVVTGEKTLGENCAVEIQEEFNAIQKDKLDSIQALSVFIENRNEIWFNIPTSDEDYSTILIFDYLKGEWIKRKSQKVNSTAVINNELYSGSNNGELLQEYIGQDFNGEYIQHYYNCSPCTLGAVNTLKVLIFPPRISIDVKDNNQFYVKYVKNLDTSKTPKIRFIKTKLKKLCYWGQFLWGKGYYAPKKTGVIYKFPTATFKILQMSFYTSESNQDFSIRNIEMSKIKVVQV